MYHDPDVQHRGQAQKSSQNGLPDVDVSQAAKARRRERQQEKECEQ